MRRSIPLLSLLLLIPLLAGCGEQAATPAPASSEPATPPVATAGEPAPAPSPPADPAAIVPAQDLAGEYRVAGVDGRDINLPHGIGASIGPDRITIHSQCVTMAWAYRFEGAALVTEPIPQVTCDRARYPEETALEAAFAAANRVRRTASNGIEFSGGGHTAVLFSQ